MNINKKTWHYNLFKFWYKVTPYQTDICFYVRGVTLGLLQAAFIATLISFIIFGMINVVLLLSTGILVATIFPKFIAAITLLLGILAWIFLVGFSIHKLYEYLKNKEVLPNVLPTIKLPTIKKGSFLDILRTRIKNQHDKLCTLVTFTKD